MGPKVFKEHTIIKYLILQIWNKYFTDILIFHKRNIKSYLYFSCRYSCGHLRQKKQRASDRISGQKMGDTRLTTNEPLTVTIKSRQVRADLEMHRYLASILGFKITIAKSCHIWRVIARLAKGP